MRPGPGPGRHGGLLGVVGNAALVLTAAVFLALAIGPHVLQYRTVTMLSGSMAPTIRPGDLIVTVPEAISAARPGQIITFNAPVAGSPVVTHRVIDVQRGDQGTVVTTRGDANHTDDGWRVRLDGPTVWRTSLILPEVGRLIAILRHPVIRVATVWGLPALVCLDILNALWLAPRAAFAR